MWGEGVEDDGVAVEVVVEVGLVVPTFAPTPRENGLGGGSCNEIDTIGSLLDLWPLDLDVFGGEDLEVRLVEEAEAVEAGWDDNNNRSKSSNANNV